jgi:hypothetical protein
VILPFAPFAFFAVTPQLNSYSSSLLVGPGFAPFGGERNCGALPSDGRS